MASVTARDHTARYLEAIERGQLERAEKLLLKVLDAQRAMPITLERGSARLVEQLLARGAHINLRESQRNGLVLANRSKVERSAKLKLLVRHGASLNAATLPSRRTLLAQAALEGDFEFARFLVESGAAINLPDYFNLTPLKAARMMGHAAIERLLLDYGAIDEQPTVYDVEQTLINRLPLWSQVHEIIKWASSNAGFRLSVLRALKVPDRSARECMAEYALSDERDRVVSVRLELWPEQKLVLVAFDPDDPSQLRDLLPPSREVGGAALRGHLTTVLSQLHAKLERSEALYEQPAAADAQTKPQEWSATQWPALELLGLPRTASRAEVLAAYRKLAKVYHPDRASGSNDRMQALNRAYETLKNK